MWQLFQKNKLILLILLLATFVRFYKLGEIPAGLHRDEAFLGYNAYSILKTGRDMGGDFLPLHLKSFIYSPAGYSYFSLPSIAFFGLSSFSVRLPAAFFGMLTVLLVYFLVQELFKKSLFSYHLSLIVSFFLAISPWHINLSRTATENIVVTFFISLGVLLYLRSIRLRSSSLQLFSFVSFAVTLLIYQASRAFLPLFLPLLIFSFSSSKQKALKPFVLYLLLIIIPIIFIITNPNLSLRLRTVSIFATQKTQLSLNEFISEDGVSQTNSTLTRVFHNKFAGYANQFLQNYFSHFSYDFLFTDEGLPDRYRIPASGLLYLFELPLLVLGTWYLFKTSRREALFLASWVLLAPVGSALSFDDLPNLQRTVIMLPALSVFTAFGFMQLTQLLKKNKPAILLIDGLVLLALFNISFYVHQYFVHQPIHQTWYRHEGYKELVTTVNYLLPSYQKAVITDRESAPAIFFLFFSKYDPATYLKETMEKGIHDYDRANFDKYEFSQEECPLRLDSKTGNLSGKTDTLYVDYGTCDVPAGTTLLQEIHRGDRSIVFRVLRLK